MKTRSLYTQSVRADLAARKLRRARRAVRRLIRMALAMITVFCLVFLLSSPHLSVNKVSVDGGTPAVRKWVEEKMKRGLGQNIILVRTGNLETVVATHPYIMSVAVVRAFPRSLVCKIGERNSYASVRVKDAFFVVDKRLVAYRKQRMPAGNRPVLSVADISEPQLGKPWKSQALNQTIRALEAARDRGLKVRQVSIDPTGYMCLNIDNGVEVRAGSPQDIEKKLYEASKFLMSQTVPVGEIDYVDVSCPSAPAYRPRMAKADAL